MASKKLDSLISKIDDHLDESEKKTDTDSSTSQKIVKLLLSSQNYDWGKPGKTSKVAQLINETNNNKKYAELWMGTHKNGPSYVILENNKKELLSKYINNDLPYLYKVLSINQALSIQAHPKKSHAQQLHKERPKIYKDPNHKPEMALALTPFEAMCGFRPSEEILFYLENTPEFKAIILDKTYKSFKENINKKNEKLIELTLKELFTQVMAAKKEDITKQLTKLLNRISKKDNPDIIKQFNDESKQNNDNNNNNDNRDINVNELVQRLNTKYPYDVGIFAVFLLNCFKLKKGEAIFLKANLPHAYLSGDCLETMACSDNVVRAGLTPKLRDTKVLCEMLEYKASKPGIMYGDNLSKYTKKYSPKVDEFALEKTRIDGDGKDVINIKSKYPSIVLCYDGKGKINNIDVRFGDCLLIPVGVNKIEITCQKDNVFEVARCYTP